MKPKKLEKRVQFIFKRTNMVNLTKEQMKGINGGNMPDKPSNLTACTIAHLPTQSEE